ncbi:sigma-54 dependent transcriptional regulator [bacterium]|nr:sigma-54 dependent transcriptional regulator [bacterium]
MQSKILVVDDEKNIRAILTRLLEDEGYAVLTAASAEEAIVLAESSGPDLVLMDQRMPGLDGIEGLVRIKARNPDITVIILTAHAEIGLAVEAIKKGAYDYLTKPFDNEELLIVIRRALERSSLAHRVNSLERELHERYSFRNLVGVSAAMRRVQEQIARVCETGATVLVEGESGTGKELVARAIHFNSRRADKPFVTVNCGAIPLSLIESELFGHEKGAFTGAVERRSGKFEQAGGGTFFLDEVGELPLEAQVKLLRVLDERRVTRLGGRESLPLDVRLIAATNKDLQQQVEKGAFRLDLFYRLNIVTLRLPPLRERREDIPVLAEHFIRKHNRLLDLSITGFSLAAADRLQAYDWPGNVRDLENAVQSAMIQAGAGTLEPQHLPMRVTAGASVAPERDAGPDSSGLGASVRQMSARLEREMIRDTLAECGNNRTEAARRLNVSRKTLYNKLHEYGLE